MIAEELYSMIRGEIRNAVEKAVREETDTWLDARQAADMLGWSIRTLYNKIAQVPHVKVGKKLRFTERTLNDFMKQ